VGRHQSPAATALQAGGRGPARKEARRGPRREDSGAAARGGSLGSEPGGRVPRRSDRRGVCGVVAEEACAAAPSDGRAASAPAHGPSPAVDRPPAPHGPAPRAHPNAHHGTDRGRQPARSQGRGGPPPPPSARDGQRAAEYPVGPPRAGRRGGLAGEEPRPAAHAGHSRHHRGLRGRGDRGVHARRAGALAGGGPAGLPGVVPLRPAWPAQGSA
jgi:hypothetical protein